MPRMAACSAFQQCSNSVKSCDLLPSTANTTQQIYSICNEMTMTGCEKCSIRSTSTYAECDLIQTYSDLCIAMPKMSQCAQFDQMCSSNSDLAFCPKQQSLTSSDGDKPPPMQMFFHNSVSDYILFENWVPRTAGQYTLAWVLVFLSAVFYEALQVFTAFQELKWAQTSSETTRMINDSVFGEDLGPKRAVQDIRSIQHMCGLSNGIGGVKQSFCRAFLRMLSTLIGYVLMLIAMTFNIGLFLAIITGFGAGTFIFAPMIKFQKFTTSQISSECH